MFNTYLFYFINILQQSFLQRLNFIQGASDE